MGASISDKLLDWYDRHARDLPWRLPPGAPRPDDPDFAYRVWLSEIMLQQTTVAAAKPYFARFIATWPSIAALAAADEAAVMAAWAGLGYYSRARNLLRCARQVAARGGFPRSEAELRRLPGLGPYTAAAIAAIAFGARAVVVDANVERVVARLFAITVPLPAARPQIRAAAETITPAARAGDFAQAMMDLGSQVCTPRAPRCPLCPLAADCAARAAGDPEALPQRAPKRAVPERRGTAFWIARANPTAPGGAEVWLVTRPPRGMLGGMRALPDDGWSARADGTGRAPIAGPRRMLGAVRHGFTHARLTLAVEALDASADPPGEGAWWPVGTIEEAGLASLFLKAARLARAAGA